MRKCFFALLFLPFSRSLYSFVHYRDGWADGWWKRMGRQSCKLEGYVCIAKAFILSFVLLIDVDGDAGNEGGVGGVGEERACTVVGI